jgi:hypothetical protein
MSGSPRTTPSERGFWRGRELRIMRFANGESEADLYRALARIGEAWRLPFD